MITTGLVWQYTRSSMTYPIMLPPFCDPVDGHLLLDGCFVNNMPGLTIRMLHVYILTDWRSRIGHVNNIPTMQFFIGIPRNTQSKSFICYNWLSVVGNSKTMHCGILINTLYFVYLLIGKRSPHKVKFFILRFIREFEKRFPDNDKRLFSVYLIVSGIFALLYVLGIGKDFYTRHQ